jgi:predicted ChrR family anti-sigma factor
VFGGALRDRVSKALTIAALCALATKRIVGGFNARNLMMRKMHAVVIGIISSLAIGHVAVGVPAESGARVFMLKAAAGTSLPHHTHTGTELMLIIRGAFSHEGGRYGVGDFDEADGSTEHQPVVEAGEECICLVAMEGGLRLLGLAGRILQPFVRM